MSDSRPLFSHGMPSFRPRDDTSIRAPRPAHVNHLDSSYFPRAAGNRAYSRLSDPPEAPIAPQNIDPNVNPQSSISQNAPPYSRFEESESQEPQPRGWVDQRYLQQNPWYGKPKPGPIFSLGRPFPHTVRRHGEKRKVVGPASDVESGNGRPFTRRKPNASFRNRTFRDQQSRDQSSIRIVEPSPLPQSARDIQQRQEENAQAGVSHGDKHNSAGQPVFDYIPHDECSYHSFNDGEEGNQLGTIHSQSKLRDEYGRGESKKESDFQADDGSTIQADGSTADVEEEEEDPNAKRNWWAKTRAKHPEPLAEFLATGVAVFLGLCGSLSVNLSRNHSMTYGTYETSCWAWGFAWMFGIYLGGGVSGAHMNPAVSVSLAIFRGFPWKKCAVYAIAQFLASIAAGALAYSVFRDSINAVDPNLVDLGRTFFSTPQEWVPMGTAVYNQIVGGAVMMIACLSLGDDQNNPPGAGMHALVFGLLTVTLKFSLGYNVGSALNPATDIGPRIIAYVTGYTKSDTFDTNWWLYGPWIGTQVGSLLGCFIYDSCIFVGTESPVNYKMSDESKARFKKFFYWKK